VRRVAVRAAASAKGVLYVTKRAVFQLSVAGLELVEVAPGIDIEGGISAAKR
jgi:propionate CoA-transferase